MPKTLAALGLIALLTAPLPVLASQRRTRCSDYATQEQARQALQRGETWLDHDSDGTPCETHFNRSNRRNPSATPRPRPTTTPTPRATPSPRR